MFSLVGRLPSRTSATGRPALFGPFVGVGSEEARPRALASVRRSNGTCSFPAYRFHEDGPRVMRTDGRNQTEVPHTNVCTIQPPAGQPRRGKRLRMCSFPRISGEVGYRSVDGRPARAPLLVGGLLDGSRSHRKLLRRWHLQGNEP